MARIMLIEAHSFQHSSLAFICEVLASDPASKLLWTCVELCQASFPFEGMEHSHKVFVRHLFFMKRAAQHIVRAYTPRRNPCTLHPIAHSISFGGIDVSIPST